MTNDHHYDVLANIPFPKVVVMSLQISYDELCKS